MFDSLKKNVSTSPVVKKETTPGMDFHKAIDEILRGKRVAKTSWDEGDCYSFLKDELLMLHRNGKDNQWIISLGDMSGTDWYTLSEEVEE